MFANDKLCYWHFALALDNLNLGSELFSLFMFYAKLTHGTMRWFLWNNDEVLYDEYYETCFMSAQHRFILGILFKFVISWDGSWVLLLLARIRKVF